MSPQRSLKLKAVMLIAMLGIAEGHRIKSNFQIADASGSKSSSSSHGEGNYESQLASQVLGGASEAPLDLGTLLDDPAFNKLLEATAEHMGAFADRMKAKPGILARANEMANEMFSLSASHPSKGTLEVSFYTNSNLPEQMEAVIADREFQSQARLLAEEMRKSVVANSDFKEQLEVSSAESTQSAEDISEELLGKLADPSFQEQQAQISRVLNALLTDPDLQSEAESIAVNLEQATDSSDAAQEVSERVDAVLETPKFREKASDVVLSMLSAGLPEDPNEWGEDARLEDMNLDELVGAVEHPSPELVKAMVAMRRAQNKQQSLLEMNQTSGGESVKFKPLKVLGRRARAVHPVLGGSGAVHRPRLSQPIMGRLQQGGLDAPPASAEASAQEYLEGESDTTNQPLTSAEGIRSMMPALVKALPLRAKSAVMSAGEKKKGVDFALLLCFALWYLGNYYYNISNKLALTAAGGAAGFPMTIATLQLGVGVIYALFLWLAPDARRRPEISFKDYVKTLPVGAMSAGAHAASVFALGAGSVSFAQIVKASEPAFAAAIGTIAYGATLSRAKWLSLIPVIGGVCLASLGELNFAVGALITASVANVFAAIKGNENKKLMDTPGLSERIGSVGNQFAITTINAFLFTLPIMLLTEGSKLGQFITLMRTSPLLLKNLLSSGLWFYLYNELATLTIKKTGAVTQSVANTAKRVIVIIVVALVMKESLTPLKLIGSGIGIGGVFLYSIIDKLVEARKAKREAKVAKASDGTSAAA